MEKRVAVIGIVVEKEESAETVNAILHEYRDVIVGRMGIPYRERGLSVISVIVDAPNATLSAISGNLGLPAGVTSNAIYATTGRGGKHKYVQSKVGKSNRIYR